MKGSRVRITSMAFKAKGQKPGRSRVSGLFWYMGMDEILKNGGSQTLAADEWYA